jgi:hypothetical protein
MKNFILLFSFILSAVISFTALSMQTHQQEYNHTSFNNEQPVSEAELAQMLAPIALYPDSLLTHILISSTYPIEIVEAHRWLKKNNKLNSNQIAKSIENFEWDASVKALVPFEQILSRLSEDLIWMQQLGDAFLQDEERVLESIQALREQAKQSGNLDKMDNMDVSYENNNIIIEPVQKEIVYVPYYDTRMVYGNWYWSSYPPVYWAPSHRVYVNHYNPFYWHSGIHISFNYFFSTFHWHKRHVVVVNPHKSRHYRSRRAISREGYAKRWSHKPVHRRGVAYKTTHTRQKYHSNRGKSFQKSKHSKSNHRQFKQRLSTNKYVTSKQKTKVVQSRKKQNTSSTNKQYSALVKHREGGRGNPNKGYKNVKSSATKLQKTKTIKHHKKIESKNSTHSRKSQNKRSSHSKTKNASRAKSHH